MAYQVYVFHPSAELVDVCDEFDEAVERCEELVQEDGYPGAEVWDEDGELVHAAGRSDAMQPARTRFRTDHSTVRSRAAVGTAPPSGDSPDEPDAGPEVQRAIEIRHGSAVVVAHSSEGSPSHGTPTDLAPTTDVAPATGPATTTPPVPNVAVLGALAPVQWFGV